MATCTPINPHSWTTTLGFDQAQLVEGHTDVDQLIKQHFAKINARFGSSRYATTILGVDHLPAQFMVMLEATAVD